MKSSQTEMVELLKLQISDGEHYDIDNPSSLPYHHIENLGHGQTAIVDKIRHTQTNVVYARKTVKIVPSKLQAVAEQYQHEIRITRRLASHHHIVRIVASYNTRDSLALILEPAADGGDLKKFLEDFVTVDNVDVRRRMESTIRRAYGCLANGLSFMHAHRIRHRDIKPENILLHGDSVLYADFGVARDYSDRAHSATEDYPGPFTRRYCAPEVVTWEQRTYKSDVFSLGCVFLLMYTAIVPNGIIEVVAKGRFHEHLDEIKDVLEGFDQEREVVECMKRMLEGAEPKRASAAEVVGILRGSMEEYFCGKCLREPCIDSVDLLSTITSSLTCFEGGGIARVRGEYLQPQRGDAPRIAEANVISSMTIGPYNANGTTAPESIISNGTLSISHSSFSPVFLDRTIHLRSSLSRYGIRQHKIVRTFRTSSDTHQDEQVFVYEDRIYDWSSPALGRCFRLRSRKGASGSILPSLSIYPVVEYFDAEIDLIQRGSIMDIQRAFATQKVHPYVQNELGQNLLYLAIRYNRLDIARLLHAHGVPPSPTHNGKSVFLEAMEHNHFSPTNAGIDMLRFLLSSLSQAPDFDSPVWRSRQSGFFWHEEVREWLYLHAEEHELDVDAVTELCLRLALRKAFLYIRHEPDRAKKTIGRFLTRDVLKRIANNGLVLLDDLFISFLHPSPSVENNWALGSLWLGLLAQNGIDVQRYIAHEFDAHPGLMLPGAYYDRKLVGGYSDENGYSLGWCISLQDTPGWPLVEEFRRLGRCEFVEEWPFIWVEEETIMKVHVDYEEELRMERRRMERAERRVEKKRRKAKKVIEQARAERTIPGSWVD